MERKMTKKRVWLTRKRYALRYGAEVARVLIIAVASITAGVAALPRTGELSIYFSMLLPVALFAALYTTTMPRRRTPARPPHIEAYDGDVYRAKVYGDDIPALEAAALDEARRFWGNGAVLRVDGMADCATSPRTAGVFTANVFVRRTNIIPRRETR